MGKAERIRRMNARERIAAQQAAAARAESRRRMLIASGSVVAVLAIVVGIIVAKSVFGAAGARNRRNERNRIASGRGHLADHHRACEHAEYCRRGNGRQDVRH